MSRRAKVRLLSLVIVLTLWEFYGRRVNPILFTYPLAIARAFIDLVLSGELQSYMKDSLLVLLYASILSVMVGVFFGVVMGRYALVEWATDIYVNALYSMPMVAKSLPTMAPEIAPTPAAMRPKLKATPWAVARTRVGKSSGK